MKYNLKNRPKSINIPSLELDFEAYDDLEVRQWFEGFEKELRETLKWLQESAASDMIAETIIEEILGE